MEAVHAKLDQARTAAHLRAWRGGPLRVERGARGWRRAGRSSCPTTSRPSATPRSPRPGRPSKRRSAPDLAAKAPLSARRRADQAGAVAGEPAAAADQSKGDDWRSLPAAGRAAPSSRRGRTFEPPTSPGCWPTTAPRLSGSSNDSPSRHVRWRLQRTGRARAGRGLRVSGTPRPLHRRPAEDRRGMGRRRLPRFPLVRGRRDQHAPPGPVRRLQRAARAAARGAQRSLPGRHPLCHHAGAARSHRHGGDRIRAGLRVRGRTVRRPLRPRDDRDPGSGRWTAARRRGQTSGQQARVSARGVVSASQRLSPARQPPGHQHLADHLPRREEGAHGSKVARPLGEVLLRSARPSRPKRPPAAFRPASGSPPPS